MGPEGGLLDPEGTTSLHRSQSRANAFSEHLLRPPLRPLGASTMLWARGVDSRAYCTPHPPTPFKSVRSFILTNMSSKKALRLWSRSFRCHSKCYVRGFVAPRSSGSCSFASETAAKKEHETSFFSRVGWGSETRNCMVRSDLVGCDPMAPPQIGRHGLQWEGEGGGNAGLPRLVTPQGGLRI